MKQFIKQLYIYAGLILCFVATSNVAKAQEVDDAIAATDSLMNDIEISLLTCEPHDQVYSLYGHTAIRIEDKRNNTDYVANWGVFDSSKPNFVPRFVLGLTDYLMAIVPTQFFIEEYKYYGSAVYQQTLALTPKEKMRILGALAENYKPENRVYRYNFFFDNCTTRARDVITSALDGEVVYQTTEMQKGEKSFRDLIHWRNSMSPWAAVGNDLLLGVQADRNTTMAERQFLPEILFGDFEKAKVKRADGTIAPLLSASTKILQSGTPMFEKTPTFPLPPMACSGIVLAVVVAVTLLERFVTKKHYRWFDIVLFSLYAIPGILLVVMIFSEHPAVKINFQIFLLNPLWVIYLLPSVGKKTKRVMAFTMLAAFFVCGIFQEYASGMYLLALSLLIRICSVIIGNHEK